MIALIFCAVLLNMKPQCKTQLNFTAASSEGSDHKLYYAIVKGEITQAGEYLSPQQVADTFSDDCQKHGN